MKSTTICVDLGGTNVRLGLVSRDGGVLFRRRLRTRLPEDQAALYDFLASRISDFAAVAGSGPKPGAVVIGFAGPTWSEAGYVYCAPNVGQLQGLDMRSEMTMRLGMPVVVANDANCAAMGEYQRGAGRGATSMFLFTIGTGVGGSFIAGGSLWEGADGIAGEVGHTVIDSRGPVCTCGNRGCLEALVSATAILKAYVRMRPGRVRDEPLTARMVFAAARRGDRAAAAAISGASEALGIGIANIFHLLDPELILIGGGVSRAGRLLLAPAVAKARSMVFGPLRDRLRVKRTELGDDAALIGAAYLA